VRVDGKKPRASVRDTPSSCRTTPLKPKAGLDGPPAQRSMRVVVDGAPFKPSFGLSGAFSRGGCWYVELTLGSASVALARASFHLSLPTSDFRLLTSQRLRKN
jgi:hypothetical protein